ncbi:hypothetical protein THF1C08_100167 [Vibrio jasicida]|uniref:Transposase n=1 Tax=Vibrio jasicida TaxID=766224 RepID=A0AAU9QYB5_9VIBR|nr:hypothetical protein THF1C08_100167 [Vibrio jasicida]CAH1604062.1 hypothetical protein THF1A12_90166 [Vibrio jasicida]
MDSFASGYVCCSSLSGDELIEKIVNPCKHLMQRELVTAEALYDSFILVIHKNSG